MILINTLTRILRAEQENQRLKQQLAEQAATYEKALVELGALVAEQEDAMVELASIITEEK